MSGIIKAPELKNALVAPVKVVTVAVPSTCKVVPDSTPTSVRLYPPHVWFAAGAMLVTVRVVTVASVPTMAPIAVFPKKELWADAIMK
jgi:hypothetical protein